LLENYPRNDKKIRFIPRSFLVINVIRERLHVCTVYLVYKHYLEAVTRDLESTLWFTTEFETLHFLYFVRINRNGRRVLHQVINRLYKALITFEILFS
jgi:hypothetical protein